MLDTILLLGVGFCAGVLVGWYSFRNSKKVQDVAEALDKKYNEAKDKVEAKVEEVVAKSKAKKTTSTKSTKTAAK